MSADDVREPRAAALVQALLQAGSDFGRQLAEFAPTPLREILVQLVDTADLPPPSQHRALVAEAIHRYLESRGDPLAEDAAAALLSHPLIQLADHSNLLFDEETFLNNWLHYLGCRLTGQEFMLVSQCSTVCCLSRRQPVAGPVFLHTRNRMVQIFDHSKRLLKNSHFCLLPAPMQLQFSDTCIAPLFDGLMDQYFSSAPEAFRVANTHLWRQLQVDSSVRRVAVDERMTSELLALHLERDGALRRLLFDPKVRETFLKVKRAYVQTRENLGINRALPDFLWLAQGTRLHEVRWEPTEPTWHTTPVPLPIPWTPEAISSALRSGQAYGSRLLAYTVRCMLPGVVALGGSVQQDYVQAYRRILLTTDAEQPFLDNTERTALAWTGSSRLAGRPLVEPDEAIHTQLQNLGPQSDLRALEASLLDVPVGATIGTLSAMSFYEEILSKARQRP